MLICKVVLCCTKKIPDRKFDLGQRGSMTRFFCVGSLGRFKECVGLSHIYLCKFVCIQIKELLSIFRIKQVYPFYQFQFEDIVYKMIFDFDMWGNIPFMENPSFGCCRSTKADTKKYPAFLFCLILCKPPMSGGMGIGL